MRDFTKRQWKALLAAYPLYATLEDSSANLSTQRTASTSATAATSDTLANLVTNLLRVGVPKVRRAFASVLKEDFAAAEDTSENSGRVPRSPAHALSIPPPLTPRRESGEVHWRESVPRDVDALLAYLFLKPDSDDGAPGKGKKENGAYPFGATCTPLTAEEKLLLGLCARERERAETFYAAQQRLEQQVRELAQSLLRCIEAPDDDIATARPAAVCTARMPLSIASNSPESTPARDRADQGADGGFRSLLAHTPLTAEALADLLRVQEASAALVRPVTAVACAECGLADGELFTCGQCGTVRHEACGGPHPPETQDEQTSLTLCRACRRALCVDSGSSSSSLRSSTSTDERAELDRDFGTDDDSTSASSLSGFIVHTSSDEDDGDDDEEAQEEGDRSGESGDETGENSAAPSTASSASSARRQPPRRGKAPRRPPSPPVEVRRDVRKDTANPRRRRPRPTTEVDAEEELETLLRHEPARHGQRTSSGRPTRRSAKQRRSELLVHSSGSSSQMSDLSDGDSA